MSRSAEIRELVCEMFGMSRHRISPIGGATPTLNVHGRYS